MKKLLIFSLLFIAMPVFALDVEEVTLSRCIDGDTAKFIVDGKEVSVRFLAIDTPEISGTAEPYGQEAADYTCALLTNATTIYLEYDENSDRYDKYDRLLAFVFVDDVLLQNEIVKKGYAEVAYLYGDYKYTTLLQVSEEMAQFNEKGIWSDSTYFSWYYLTIFIAPLLAYYYKKLKKSFR